MRAQTSMATVNDFMVSGYEDGVSQVRSGNSCAVIGRMQWVMQLTHPINVRRAWHQLHIDRLGGQIGIMQPYTLHTVYRFSTVKAGAGHGA